MDLKTDNKLSLWPQISVVGSASTAVVACCWHYWCYKSPITNIAALRCTIYRLCMLLTVWGAHITLEYSIWGRTKVYLAQSLPTHRFLWRKALVLFAFLMTWFIRKFKLSLLRVLCRFHFLRDVTMDCEWTVFC